MDVLKELSIFYYGRKHHIGEIIVDAVIKENHELRATATEHPTESGESFVDHVQNQPVSLQIEGIITSTPSRFLGLPLVESLSNFIQDKKVKSKTDSNNLAEIAFKKLEELFMRRQPISISTTLKDYDNMVLESLIVERNSHTAASLHFRASAKEIRIVNQALIKMPAPKKERVEPKQDLGKQESKEASAVAKTATKQSMLTWITNGVSSLWK